MKNLKRIFIAILAIVAIGGTADAQFRWGVKAGVNVNKLHLSKEVVSDVAKPDNQTGYQFGLQTEFTVPIIGVGFDASLMYNHRKYGEGDNGSANFIDVPIHFKYKMGLPGVGSLISPYLIVGPDFAFNVSGKDAKAAFKEKKFDTFLDLGIGVEIIKHLQIGATYSLGLNKAFEYINPLNSESVGTAKINGWVVTAAYMF